MMLHAGILCLVIVIECCHGYTPDYKDDAKHCEPDCESQIFCAGELLHDVQTSRVFKDGTVFVEKQLLYSEQEIVEKYKKFKRRWKGVPPVKELRSFVDQHFANDSLSTCHFDDFNPNPSILKTTDNPKYKEWLKALNNLWVELGGEISPEVKKNPDRHSYLYVPNKFIKAGGRFTGTYYWDSFWIVKGLLLCDMRDTARGIIENIVTLVEKYEHMPNGNRIYYIKRSQPPMLILMANAYYEMTKNLTFIEKNIKAFEKEFNWWMTHRQVDVWKNNKVYSMFRYKSISCTPRPESYAEDFELVKTMTSNEQKVKVFTGIRSAAESGWDFSSRHIRAADHSNEGTLRQMDSMNLVYVDVNSILHANAKVLETWQRLLGNKYRVSYYKKIADDLMIAINEVLWNDTIGVWQDFDLITDTHRNYFYVSNLTPLWSKSYMNKNQIERAIKYLVSQEILDKDLNPKYYCVPTSKDNTTEQWDYPNCWAPLQAFLIEGLYNNREISEDAGKAALNLAQMWIKTTYEGFRQSSVMYEKYHATKLGSTGAGGEYEPQTGFGWTNGFTMEVFQMWGNKIQ